MSIRVEKSVTSSHRLRISGLMILLGLGLSCASPPPGPPPIVTLYPPDPVDIAENFPFEAQPRLDYRFEPVGGVESLSKDGVTVTVLDLSSVPTAEGALRTSFLGPDNQEHAVGLAPLILTLNIHNQTGDLLTLTRTSVKIRDDNDRSYVAGAAISVLKSQLADILRIALDFYRSQTQTGIENLYLPGSPYAEQFEQLREDYYCAHSPNQAPCPRERHDRSRKIRFAGDLGYIPVEPTKVRTDDMADSEHLHESLNFDLAEPAFEADFGHLAPEVLRREARAKLRLDVAASQRAVVRATNVLNDDVRNVITSGSYLPIRIQSGRRREVIVPIFQEELGSLESAMQLKVGIHGVPTSAAIGDEAPAVRNFDFRFDVKHGPAS